MKWIDYIFECFHLVFVHAGGGTDEELYIKSMQRFENSTDLVVGIISVMVGTAILICAIVLTRHLWKKYHPPEPYKGYYSLNENVCPHEEKSSSEKNTQMLDENHHSEDNS
ncbi:hypothetical protein [Pumilibacter muris]|jgi:hypothetical protein|uniref:hypothetical protein n=1 Tax=Pumilibacter muris TaxID=2941510 RepID=UPI00203CBE2D|nr:hypothetical protein [Pumilibacter muris]